MAVEDFDQYIDDLAEDHGAVAMMMTQSLLGYLRGVLRAEETEQAIDTSSDALRQAQQAFTEDVAPAIYADGVKVGGLRIGVAGREAAGSSPLHDPALQLMVADLSQELAQTTDRMSDDAKKSLREIGRRQLTNMIATGQNSVPQSRDFESQMEERGVRFVDRGGRRWDARDYARMVLRTHAGIIHNEANLNAAAEMGSRAVAVRDGGPGDVDEPCRIANGQVWSRGYAAAHLLEHPNCRRAFAPLPPSYSGKIDRQ